MAKLYNLARMTTATTGTGTITLGAAATGFISFSSAGISDGQTVTYAIDDGNSREIGRGVYTDSGTTLTRSVLKSTNANSAINLSGNAQVFITAAAEDFNSLDNTTGSFSVTLAAGTNVTANRTLTITTGDANRTLDISSGNVTVSAFGATLVDDADAATARGTLGLVTSTTAGRLSRFTGATGETGQTSALFEDGSGNVGVGTTTPSEKFHVSGGRFLVTGTGYTTNPAGLLFGQYDSLTAYMQMMSGGKFQIWSSSTGVVATFLNSGNVGIGSSATSPSYLLTLSSDSAAKPSTSTWTVSSDARLKTNIMPANLERCWDIVKGIPLKRYTWRDDVYAADSVTDRSKLGWIAQDVQPFFARAVAQYKFQKLTIRPKLDGQGNPVLDDNQQPVTEHETIDDCLSLNADQLYAAMYGALQLAISRIEELERSIGEFANQVGSGS